LLLLVPFSTPNRPAKHLPSIPPASLHCWPKANNPTLLLPLLLLCCHFVSRLYNQVHPRSM
jgi:hypothetical protein